MDKRTAQAAKVKPAPAAAAAGPSATTSRPRPEFGHLRKVTSDHVDTAALDPDEHHHPHDDIEEEDEEDHHDDSSERTAHDERQSPTNQTAKDGEKSNQGAENTATPTQKQPDQQQQPKDLEKGNNVRQRRRADTQASGKWQDPETRAWKDDIVTFNSKDDPENPQNWPYRRKVTVVALYGMTTMCSTFASSVFSPALSYVAAEYGISSEVAVLGISLFVLGYVPGPICFAPISELYGRKISVVIPAFIFICFSAATATATNIQTIMITRFFAGVFASAPVSNVGGALADLFGPKERATAVVFYSLAVVAGPTLGPVIGGAVSQSYLGWRWTEYLTVILTGTILTLDVFFIPETFAPVLLTRKARQLRWKTGRWALHSRQEATPISIKTFLQKNLLLPIKMIVTEPMITCITLFNSFVYGVLYLLFAAVPIVYEEQRGYNTLVGSLPFLSVLLGCFAAAAINLVYSQKVFARKFEENDGKSEPEWRLPPMILGSICFPIGFFLLGWTSNPSINWFPSVLGLFFIGMSFLLIFQSGINYLIDAYTQYAASAVAANTFMRSLFAAALPLVAQPMFHNLTVPWACTLLGCLAVLLAVIPVIFMKFGKKLRSKSKLAAGSLQ